MGLDMYLSAKRYLSSYDEADQKIAKNIEAMPTGRQGMRVKEISCEAMYWRKANAIHRWFVDHCQEGQDDCREYYVSIEDLEHLLADCETILSDQKKAPDVLPTCAGFFFGSTNFDEWFWQDVERTVSELQNILGNPDLMKWEFYYRSSW